MASFATIRLVAAAVGAFNFIIFILVFSIPFWRMTSVSASSEALANIWAHEGLWLECFSLYNKAAQCGQIGTTTDMGSTNSRRDSPYYMYGIYAYLGAYRTLMIVALVTALGALALSLTGMRCNKFLKEEGAPKHWINVAAGICHFLTGILTCIACSWYAALVVKEQTSPFYQTTRLKYSIGACIYMGWITSAVYIVLGCVLTCCICFNRPVDDEYEYKPPISEIDIPTQPVASMRMSSEKANTYDDEWDDYSESRYTSSKKSHRSHRSGRSGRSRNERRSNRRDDEYDYDDDRRRYEEEGRSRYYDGYV